VRILLAALVSPAMKSSDKMFGAGRYRCRGAYRTMY
jgi:hypothetical protein